MRQKLRGEYQWRAVFPGFRKERHKGARGSHIRKLICVDREGPPFGFRNILAAEGRKHQLAENHGAQEVGGVFADSPLREIEDDDFAFVHQAAELEKVSALADDVPDQGSRRELPYFVFESEKLHPRGMPACSGHIPPSRNGARRDCRRCSCWP